MPICRRSSHSSSAAASAACRATSASEALAKRSGSRAKSSGSASSASSRPISAASRSISAGSASSRCAWVKLSRGARAAAGGAAARGFARRGRRRRRRRSRRAARGSRTSRRRRSIARPSPSMAIVVVATRSMKSRSWLTSEHGAVVVGDQLLEQVERLDVEVVGRLVEHQQVRTRAPSAGRAAAAPARRRTGPRPARAPAPRRRGSPSDSRRRGAGGRAPSPGRSAAGASPVSVSQSETSGSSAARFWSKTAGTRLAPSRTRPASGASAPVRMLSSVVLPDAVRPDQRHPLAAADAEREVARRSCARRRPWRHPLRLDHQPARRLAPRRTPSAPCPAGRWRRAARRGARRAGAPGPGCAAAGGDALDRPAALGLDQPVELVAGGVLLLVDLVAPRLEAGEAAVEAGAPRRGRPRACGRSGAAGTPGRG